MLYIILKPEGPVQSTPFAQSGSVLFFFLYFLYLSSEKQFCPTDGLLVWAAWEKCLCSSLAIEQLSRILRFIQNLLFSDFWWAMYWEAIPACFIGPYMLLLQGRNSETDKNSSIPGKSIRKQEELVTLGQCALDLIDRG